MALIETEEAARRLARAISSDLALYNEDKIADGIRNDNLFDVMEDEIQEGRDLYQSRVASLAIKASTKNSRSTSSGKFVTSTTALKTLSLSEPATR